MKTFYFLFLATLASVFYSCDDNYSDLPVEVTYEPAPFDQIQLATSSQIRLVQSNTYKIIVNGQERDVHDTDVHVNGHQLTIEEHGHIDHDQVITIYVPEISELESTGSSSIYGETDFIQGRDLDIKVTGSGEIDMYIDVDHLDVNLTGSSYLYLQGFADQVDTDISGSGWVRSFGLETHQMDLRIEGRGSSEVHVDDELDVVITGSGNVYYKGHPLLDVTITGSGRVIDAN
jgi:hypothetical protein